MKTVTGKTINESRKLIQTFPKINANKIRNQIYTGSKNKIKSIRN
jgi:hypothetical protein